jgi:hypothetical protein
MPKRHPRTRYAPHTTCPKRSTGSAFENVPRKPILATFAGLTLFLHVQTALSLFSPWGCAPHQICLSRTSMDSLDSIIRDAVVALAERVRPYASPGVQPRDALARS